MSSLLERHFLHRGCGAEFEMEAAWIARHLPHGPALIVDVGCGNGALFDIIGQGRVIGVDHLADGLAHTRARFGEVPLVCADARRLPFPNAALDVITSQHVLEHLPAFEAACRDWMRVLKPGGRLLLLTPNRSFRDPSVYDDDSHVHIFAKSDLRRVLLRVGFHILDLRTLGLPWFRNYGRVPGAWRFRRFVTRRAIGLSRVPPWRWRGQTLCCAAGRPTN